MNIRISRIFIAICAMALSYGVQAQEDSYIHIRHDLSSGVEIQEIADRAYDNSESYWAKAAGPGRDGADDELSAGEAVTEIYSNAIKAGSNSSQDPNAADIVRITIAVVDAWPNCQDTFDAVRAAVSLQPARADEIIANLAVKRDCNCSNGGLWLEQRVDDRIRVEARHAYLDAPVQCSCSQVAMYAGIAGLPENREFTPELGEVQKNAIIHRMVERIQTITDRTAALQSMNSWECGCSDINIAASMQGIEQEELRDGTYDGLAHKYSDETAAKGLIVDSFGIVGTHPPGQWGDGSYASQDNVLRRDGEVFRGDKLILDPFHPKTEFTAHGNGNHAHLGTHSHTSSEFLTDLIISEYIEGPSGAAQRNRVIELYNGSDRTIDLGKDQYFLEIYTGTDGGQGDMDPRQAIGLNGAVGAGETWVIAHDESDELIKEKAHVVTGQLDFKANETLVIRRMGGEMAMNCRIHHHTFVTNFPAIPFIRHPDDGTVPGPPADDDVASPN